MAKAAADPPKETAPRRGRLLPFVAALTLARGGFASTYLGYWSPVALIGDLTGHGQRSPLGESLFVALPVIEMNLPGSERELTLSLSIETDTAHKKKIDQLMPRLRDAFTIFLSGIDPAAYDKRGVLEIIRAELKTRAQLVLGDQVAKDVLITEYRIR
ncbi:flagellar basal body-associated FliL family protein [Paracoccus caeni]|uniref:Flagellar protein FliL n=1 Tax=Paracoccus caeni TaxID=657651 RepID=A0A934VYQ0_9RHOB|nr:flagellar basal body-associated FliL family protein [Paracoccus caeni]MBK4214995.1 flagellar basal body-associated FliL family protein [Paracoccus caeni]